MNPKTEPIASIPNRNGTHAILPAAVPDSRDFHRRIHELKKLPAGWFDGIGRALDADGLDWLAERFDAIGADRLPRPYLFPTPEGRVLAEWNRHPWSYTLEIDLRARVGQWHALDVESDVEESADLDLVRIESWDRLIGWVRNRDAVIA